MSTVKADYLVNAAGTGAPTFTNGIVSSVAIPLSSGGTGATTGAGAFANLMGYTSTATNAGATNLTNTSTQYQLFTGTLVQTIRLPTTSTLTTGWTFHIVNNSTANLTVNATGSSYVCTVTPQTTAMVTCISTSVSDNTAWEYGFTDFGAGTAGQVLTAAGSGYAPSWATASGVGLGQTWQTVTGSRALNTNYTNSTGKPIMVNIMIIQGSGGQGRFRVDGVDVSGQNLANAGLPSMISAIVPPSSVYQMATTAGSQSISFWAELR